MDNIKKYQTRKRSVLSETDQLRDINEKKEQCAFVAFKKDLDFSRENNLNLTRILRFKLHEWLIEHFGEF